MSDQQIKNLFKVWLKKSRRKSDHFSKFLFLWICFNAWIAYKSREDSGRDMINWLVRQNSQSSDLVECFEACKNKRTFVDILKIFAAKSPFKDSREKRPDINVKDENDFENIVNAIYRIRCNLFHGSSVAHENETQAVIALSTRILNEWIETLNVRING
jgi:hypothetical protein